jgi:hypothetical protein
MVFALAYGINAGVLSRADFLPAVQRGWAWLSTVALQPSGFLGWCQQTGDSPTIDIYANSTESFCVGAFMSAAAQVSQLGAA